MHESAIAASWKKKSIINNDIYGSEINKIPVVNIGISMTRLEIKMA